MTKAEGATRVDDFLPLSRVDFLVLLVLTDGDRHGYGIVMEIGERTEGRIQLLPGNLYSVMNRLTKSGLVDRAPEDPQRDPENRRRRYYRITPLGQRALAAEASDLSTLVQEAAARDLLKTETPV
ncbi:PadR family transcriptional regulator [Gemmatimonadota bacterium]